jgi:hypothetical protein
MFKLIKRSLAAATAVFLISAPATAFARFNLDPSPASVDSVVQAPLPQPTATMSAAQGFQWDDAGVGAAGVLVLVGLGSGAVLARRRRPRHPLAS